MSESGLGPLEHRVPEALRGTAAYHVPQPPIVRAKLDANELPYGLPQHLRDQLGRHLAEVSLERYPDPSARELRALVASQLGIAGDQIVFGNGSDESIAFLIAAFAAPREAAVHGGGGSRPAAILYPIPSFVYYRLASVARGVEPIEVPLTAQFELDEDEIIRAIEAHRPSVVFLALPNNPTGTLWRMSFALELAARFRDVVIVSDEAYVAYSKQTLLGGLEHHPNLVVMRTLSKVGMAGMRVGYTVSSPAIAQLLDKVRPPYNVSSLDQRAAVFLLDEAREWCAARAAEVVGERKKLEAALAALPGVEVFASEANLVLARFGPAGRSESGRLHDRHGRAAAIWQGLADRGLLVRNFDRPGPLAGCLRITVGTPEENRWLVEALTELCAG